MRVLLKSTLIISTILSVFTLQAQSVDSLVNSAESRVSVVHRVKAGPTSGGTKALNTKAERQKIGRLKNIYKIDEGIYRSEQPGTNDFIALENEGLIEVLNLRRFQNNKREARKTDLKLHHISMKAGDIEERKVIRALKIIKERKGPILIHCWHGSDRTGMLVAMYRLVFQNWTKEDAIHEMTKGNFGFHSVYGNIIDFVRTVDVDKIKEKIGLTDDNGTQETLAFASGQ